MLTPFSEDIVFQLDVKLNSILGEIVRLPQRYPSQRYFVVVFALLLLAYCCFWRKVTIVAGYSKVK